MAESEVEKAAAEALDLELIETELAQHLDDLGWQTQEASRTSWDDLPIANKATMRVAVAALFREFSLSAPEEEWEYGVHHVESGGDASMLVHESREAAESDLATCGMFCDLARRTKAIPAGPWLPIPAPEAGENRG